MLNALRLLVCRSESARMSIVRQYQNFVQSPNTREPVSMLLQPALVSSSRQDYICCCDQYTCTALYHTVPELQLLQIHVQAPNWLTSVIQREPWVLDSNELYQVAFCVNNYRTGTGTFKKLQHALEARQQILQIREVFLMRPELASHGAVMTSWMLKHHIL